MLRLTSESSWWGRYTGRVYQGRLLVLLLFLLQLFPAVDYYIHQGRLPFVGEILYQGISLMTWSALPALLIALFPGRQVRYVLSLLVSVVYALLLIFEAFLVYSYSSLYTDSIALNILATNPDEASSFLANLNYKSLLLPLLVLLVLLGSFVYLIRSVSAQRPRLAGWFTCALLLFLPLSILIAQPAQRSTMSYLFMAPVERLYRGTTVCLRDAKELADYTRRAKEIDLGEVKQTKPLEGVNVVVIVGESMRRDYMHCYGYPLANTPAQDSLLATGDLIAFSNVISSASWTTGSVSEALSFYHREGKEKEWYQYPSLPYVMSRAGYYSFWLSNQEKQGSSIQPIATLASTADSALFAKNRAAGDWNSAADLELIPLLPDLSKLPQGKSLFQVIHLMGSHTPYKDRSTSGLAPFTTKDLPATLPNGAPTPKDEHRREILRDYVNSIYYNDEVIRQVVQHFASTPTLLIYFSDHGQILFENPDRPDYYEHEASLPGVSIPFFVYCSPSLRAAHPEFYATILQAKDRKIMNDLFSNSLCGLLGIQLKQYEPRYDFFSPTYDTARKRIISGYDGAAMEL